MTEIEQYRRKQIIEWLDFYGISEEVKERILSLADDYANISRSEGYRRGVQELSAGIQEDIQRKLERG